MWLGPQMGEETPIRGRVWLVDATDMSEIGVADEVFERGVLPLKRLLAVREEREIGGEVAEGDTVFLWVERCAVVGTGCVRESTVKGDGDVSVEWDWSFGRRLPRQVKWEPGAFEWDDRVALFARNGDAKLPFASDRDPLVIELSGKDVLALIRCGERY